MSTIFDSHCHPQFPQYGDEREAMIARALAAGVHMIAIGTDFETSKQGIDLAQAHEGMWATVGLHPNDADNSQFSIINFQKLLSEPKVIAVGEMGLDYYRTEGDKEQLNQKNQFIEQLKMAAEAGLPVVLHCRDGKSGSTGRAYPDMIGIIKNWKLEIENSGRPWRSGVVHSCTASLNEAQQFLDLGFYLGFNGIITFARTYDDLVRATPLDRILLETDAPFLTPEPYRGKPNEPAFVIEVAKKVAELKNESLEKVIEQTTQNCQDLFKI